MQQKDGAASARAVREDCPLRVELDSPPVLGRQEAEKPPKAPRWEQYCAFQGHEDS